MIKVNIGDAKAHFSHYIQQARAGEQVVICYHNNPVVELKLIDPIAKISRPLGCASREIKILDEDTLINGWSEEDLSDWNNMNIPE